MLAAVNAPQSKSVSIAFMALKSSILGLVMTHTMKPILSNSECLNSLSVFNSMLGLFFLLTSILDLFAMVYFFCQSDFNCIEYYVFYGVHLILTIIVIVGVLSLIGSHRCNVGFEFMLSIMWLVIIFEINCLVMMWSNLYLSLKFAHFGSNILWALIWFGTKHNCHNNLIIFVACLHGLLSLSNIIMLLSIKCIKKTRMALQCWKICTLGSIFVLLVCYLVVMIGLLTPESCKDASFFKYSYEKYGLIELISPILVLIFLKSEAGDPRQKTIEKHEQIFKLRQHQHINFEEKD